MDIHELGLNVVFWVQKNLSFLQVFFLWFSNLGDPRNVFLLIFPICYGLNSKIGINCIWIASLTEWSNAILKWFFQDDRPYWFIKSKSFSHLKLKQFPITCETGPGFPSGHVMSISAVGLHILFALNTRISNNAALGNNKKVFLKHFNMAVFLTITTLVAVSRVYIATHFPHQVIAAVFFGLCITIIVNKISNHYDTSDCKLCICFSVVLLLAAFLFHGILVALKFDPSATVTLAKKWCTKSEWVHLDTTPFYAVIRDSGALFGLGIGIEFLKNIAVINHKNDSLAQNVMQILLNLFLCLCLESWAIPQENFIVFYCLAFCKFAAVSVIIVCVTPVIVDNCHRILVYNTDHKLK